MKTLRVMLSVLAVVLAFGAAIASVKRAPQPIVYDFIDMTGTANDRCVAVNLECSPEGDIPCKVDPGDPRVLRSTTNPLSPTFCGQQLKREE